MATTLTRTVGLRLTVILLLAVFGSMQARTQERISIIPQPRELKATGQNFPIDRNAHIVLADPRSTDDKFAVDDFLTDLKSTANASLKVSRNRGRKAIVLGLLTQPVIQQ